MFSEPGLPALSRPCVSQQRNPAEKWRLSQVFIVLQVYIVVYSSNDWSGICFLKKSGRPAQELFSRGQTETFDLELPAGLGEPTSIRWRLPVLSERLRLIAHQLELGAVPQASSGEACIDIKLHPSFWLATDSGVKSLSSDWLGLISR
jgi:hypothetical protein